MKADFDALSNLDRAVRSLAKPGGLLGVIDNASKQNAMAIGWFNFGVVWERPCCIVYVRPSRYSYTCIEHSQEFTVNLGDESITRAVQICGTMSGRGSDKLTAAGLTWSKGRLVSAPIINECILHYECKVMYYTDVSAPSLSKSVISACYPSGDFHRIYFGEIVASYGDLEQLAIS
jgi:flavin reductase (DIM6/NTAB) family NADH-FMN oxidoreductase RutF